MTDYPTQYGHRIDSIEASDGSTLTQADDGTPWIHRPQETVQYTITLTHVLITHTDFEALEAFYQANKSSYVDFTDAHTGTVYSVLMRGPHRKTKNHNGVYCDAQITLRGTRSGG